MLRRRIVLVSSFAPTGLVGAGHLVVDWFERVVLLGDPKMLAAENPPFELIYFYGDSSGAPVEECWWQFKQFLGNCSFEAIPALRDAIPTAVDTITLFTLHTYLCLYV